MFSVDAVLSFLVTLLLSFLDSAYSSQALLLPAIVPYFSVEYLSLSYMLGLSSVFS